MDRRSLLRLAGAALGAAAVGQAGKAFALDAQEPPVPAAKAAWLIRLDPDPSRAAVSFLSWDTEGGEKATTNLLRVHSSLVLRARTGGTWKESTGLPTKRSDTATKGTLYNIAVAPGAELKWTIENARQQLTMTVASHGQDLDAIEAVELAFPFDPRVTPTTVIPASWSAHGYGTLPAVISSPDYGQMLLEDRSRSGIRVRLEGSREEQTVDLILELPGTSSGHAHTLTLTPIHLSPPVGLTDTSLWQQVRRGWFNTWQPSSQWGKQDRPFSAPQGILSNNVISDPVSFALPFYADQALWTPEIAPGVSVMTNVRRTIDWWLDKRCDSSGEVIGYWNYRHFLDANPGILIASWDYVEATNDLAWLRRRIEKLELLATFLEQRDVDGDGMVEATQSGNYNTLLQPARSCCWFDALNCGHKDGYTNAFIYRAWRCLAELEGQIGRTEKQARYKHLADRLKSVYAKTLYNPETGWLAWWKSADGTLHDYATPVVNGLAIEYGLVEPEQGRTILQRLRIKMQQAGFHRLDLGLPCTLAPVLRSDYLQPDGLGIPSRQDGTDTFETYMNGGISAGHTLHFIMAHQIVGEPEKGDAILQAMLRRQASVGFQNGVQNKADQGIDWTDWKGDPKGYEGYLADVFMFLQAAVLREKPLQSRFYRPLRA
jgi:hypothetical protein